jgi:RNA polymerase sigma-70 factor (ECF subfamily)
MIDSVPVPVAALDFEGLYRAHVRELYAFVYARVGNREAAEDITADIFVKALTHLDLARAKHSVVAWLFRVARNTVTDYWRQGHGRDSVAIEEVPAAGTPPLTVLDAARQTDTAARARALLDQLPENFRVVLSYRLLDGATVAETARLMNLSEGNVKVLQHRALIRARQLCEDSATDTPRSP